MKTIFLISTLIILFNGCSQEKKVNHLDGKKLLVQKCSQCHNIDLPPKIFDDEKAPPMMSVTFHVKSFIKTLDKSQKIPKAIEFIKDYVINPSKSKSFCDEDSLKRYGVMPSQKGKVTQDELEAITKYMFTYFTQKNLATAQELKNKFEAMPKGERLVMQNGCLSCHKIDKHIVGPAFKEIAKKKENTLNSLIYSLKNGSKNKYPISQAATMPAFKKISNNDLKVIVKWILSLKTNYTIQH